jgi:hypothetical protein
VAFLMAVYQDIRPFIVVRPAPRRRPTAHDRPGPHRRPTVDDHLFPQRWPAVGDRAAGQRMAVPRRRQAAHVRSGRSQGRVGLALTGILVAFLLALFYLTQTVHVAATNYDIGSLLSDRDRMNQQIQSLQGDIARLGAEHAVSRHAQEQGLDALGVAVWVGSR